jgi:hypothetical protein
MKLYTEEQVTRLVINMSPRYMIKRQIQDIIAEQVTPIELPSDEEIGKDIGSGMHDFYKGGFIEGAKWMKEQILNQNK